MIRALRSRWTPWALLTLTLLVAGLAVRHQWALRADAEFQAGWTKQLNDSTQAQLASREAEIRALKEASKQLGGTLVSGVRIRTRADTVFVPVKEAETVTRDSTRYATVWDSTKAGIRLRVDAEAPPFPAPLRIGYQLTVPEFTPEIGFVRRGETYAAVVNWEGQTFTIEDAFHVPTGPKDPRLSLVGGGRLESDFDGRLHPPEMYAGAWLRVSDRFRVGLTGTVGWESDPLLGVSVERVLWSR